jgi:hypothetical protein
MTRLKQSGGQAYVMTAMFMGLVLIPMTAAVLDVGSWFRADRALQATVDAAALAGAQALPDDPGAATALAVEYGNKNGGGITAGNVSFEGGDTIVVDATRPAPGFFAKIFGIDTVTVHAKAKARTAGISAAQYVAPIVVNWKHPKLQCGDEPCAGDAVLEYQHLKTDNGKGNDDDDDDDGGPTNDGAGSFGFINLTGENGVGSSDLGEWIANGFTGYMELGTYLTSTGNPFSSSHVKDSLEERIGSDRDVLLFPIYQTLQGTGDNAEYEIIGWVAFRITSMDLAGNNEKLFGEFVEVIWEGIQVQSGGGSGIGVRAIALVE